MFFDILGDNFSKNTLLLEVAYVWSTILSDININELNWLQSWYSAVTWTNSPFGSVADALIDLDPEFIKKLISQFSELFDSLKYIPKL